MFPDMSSARGRLTRRYTLGLQLAAALALSLVAGALSVSQSAAYCGIEFLSSWSQTASRTSGQSVASVVCGKPWLATTA
jgi:hypothetical protein